MEQFAAKANSSNIGIRSLAFGLPLLGIGWGFGVINCCLKLLSSDKSSVRPRVLRSLFRTRSREFIYEPVDFHAFGGTIAKEREMFALQALEDRVRMSSHERRGGREDSRFFC